MRVTRIPRRKRNQQQQAQLDLKAAPHNTPPKPAAKRPQQPRATGHTPLQADLFTHPLPPPPRQHLRAQDIRLTRIALKNIATARPEREQWLYLAVPEHTATEYLANGITLSRTHPLLLTTLDGIRAWLTKLHEQAEHEHLEPLCILRLHKTMVEELLEPEPDQSARFSSPFFWLKKI